MSVLDIRDSYVEAGREKKLNANLRDSYRFEMAESLECTIDQYDYGRPVWYTEDVVDEDVTYEPHYTDLLNEPMVVDIINPEWPPSYEELIALLDLSDTDDDDYMFIDPLIM